jgi:hypothetical protein
MSIDDVKEMIYTSIDEANLHVRYNESGKTLSACIFNDNNYYYIYSENDKIYVVHNYLIIKIYSSTTGEELFDSKMLEINY